MNQYEIELRDKVALMVIDTLGRMISTGQITNPSITAFDVAQEFMAERRRRDKEASAAMRQEEASHRQSPDNIEEPKMKNGDLATVEGVAGTFIVEGMEE